METVFKKKGAYVSAVKRNIVLLLAAIFTLGIALMKSTGWIIIPSVIIGKSGGFVVRLLQLYVPVKIREGRLIQRTANLNWFDSVDLSNVTKVEVLPVGNARAALKGIFSPSAGIILYYNTYDELFVECESADLLGEIVKAAPEAEVVRL